MAICSLMQTISFIYLIVVYRYTVASLIRHDEECLALFQFKQSLFHQGDADSSSGGFQKFRSWRKITSNISDDNGSDCCLWDGVACSNEGRVTRLDLSESFLRGPINSNSTLFNLVHLQMLNLSMNNFSESLIPSGFSRLKQLRSLDLSYSGLSGQIPKEISQLVQLSSLNLSFNPLKLQSPSLEYLFQNFTRLEELDLSGVDISSFIPHFFSNFSSLRAIYLDDCSLRDEFPSDIFHLPTLKYLTMKNNPNLTGSMPEFRNNTTLEHLDLRLTGFSGIIPASISKLQHMVFLDLSRCYFSGHIPGSLSNLTQLTHLGLGQNELTGLVPSLATLSKLVFLELSENEFEKGSSYDWISKLTNIHTLNLNRMNIFNEFLLPVANLTKLGVLSIEDNFIFGSIPSSFMNLTQLITINLKGNQLHGPISSAFSNFKSLEFFGLDLNNFSGRVDLDTFAGLAKLTTLHLRYNNVSFVTSNNYTDRILPELKLLGLSSCNLKEFPSFLRYQNKLTLLFLDDNKIEGLIPVWLWNNSRETLLVLDISHNFITGFHQHPQFLPWVRLEAISVAYNQLQGRRLPIPPHTTIFYDFSNNNLTGEIPSLMCELKSLGVLDLSSNNMTGTLPPCLGNLSNTLSVLNLNRNSFHGTLVNTFMYGSRLQSIDLSENQLTGQVSKSLANCSNLEFLSLGDNSFEDVFPLWLGTLPELQVLILRSNKFYGEIQGLTTISAHFPKLRIIDLSKNGFSGRLPDKSFQTWNAMKSVYLGKSFAMGFEIPLKSFLPITLTYSMTLTNKGVKTEYKRILSIFTSIDLSCNKFEGKIPQSLHDLQGLQSLNLSNNHLTGNVLPSLGNLTNLESLDLSQNELSGNIPQQLLRLGFLAIFNVSFNHLNGRIPQGRQFNTFENNSYKGNPGLCGEPLSKKCTNSKTSTLPQTSNDSNSATLLPSNRIDWIIIFLGVVNGFIIGIVFGKSRSSRYSHWLVKRIKMTKERRVKPVRHTRRSQIFL